jgi:hypothetical protein
MSEKKFEIVYFANARLAGVEHWHKLLTLHGNGADERMLV